MYTQVGCVYLLVILQKIMINEIRENIATTYNKYADNYETKFMQMDLYNDTYDKLCELAPNNASILEIASGPGNVTKYLLEKRPDLIITGIDIAPSMINIATKNNPSAKYFLMDCKDILDLNNTFNIVICAFCIPYLSQKEVTSIITDSVKLMPDNGLFYISSMIDSYSRSGYEKTSFTGDDSLYIYYHEEGFLKNEFQKNGLFIEDSFTTNYPESDGSFTKEMIFICRKQNTKPQHAL